MITYILQMTICASLLLAVYYLLLEKEKMHRFKRLYLLFSLAFSLVVPFISINITGDISILEKLPFTTVISTQTVTVAEHQHIAHEIVEETGLSVKNILLTLYIVGTLLLLSRFVYNVAVLIKSIKRSNTIECGSARIVLTDNDLIPHSFGNYIFLNKEKYRTGQIENEIITHEMVHIQQRHTVDVILIELLLVLFWFNPILYIYKNRIKLNHEFLADEGVINAHDNVPQYQMILIDNISRQNSLSLTSNFNYLLTKKRLTMMTKTTPIRIAVIKKIVLLPLFLIFAFTFCSKKANNEQQIQKEDEVVNITVKQDSVTPDKDGEEFVMTNIKIEDAEKGKTAPPPPPVKREGKRTVKFVPAVKDEEKKTPPPPPVKIVRDEPLDLSSYKVGDKYIDKDGREWKVLSINPPQLQTAAKSKKSEVITVTKATTLDLSSYKIGDKYIDDKGHEWEVVSIDPPRLKTTPPPPPPIKVEVK